MVLGHSERRDSAARAVPAISLLVTLIYVLLPSPAVAQRAADSSMEEVIVSASARPIEAAKVGSAVSVISADDLHTGGVQYASDALRRVPGVAVNRSGSFGGLTQVRMRGAEGNQVLVLIDGVEVAGSGSGEFDFSSLLAEGIERIEVLRGPQSGLYGGNAMAGVINIVTAGAGPSGVDFSAEAGSFGTTQVSLSARGGNDRRFGALTVTSRQTDGINTSPSGDERDGDENLTFFGRGHIQASDIFSLDGSFRVAQKESDMDAFDFSGGPTQGLSIDSDDFAESKDAQIAGGVEWSLRDGGWVTRLSASYFEGKSSGGVSPYGSKATREQLRLVTTYAFNARSPHYAQFVTAFVEHEDETYRNTVPEDPSQAAKLRRGILGVGLEYRAEVGERLFLSGAVRSDDNDGFDDATTFRATAAYLVGRGRRTRIHASYGTGVTNPTFFEQFGFVPGTFVGNPNLRPEEVTGWDAGIEQRFAGGRVSFDITYFDADLENEITSIFPSVENDSGTSKRRGVELTLTGEIADSLSLSSSFTYTDAKDPDGTEEVRRPPRSASVDLVYRARSDRLTVYAGIVHNGRMLDNDFRNFFVNFAAEKTPVDAYTLLNVGAYYDVTERLQLFGRLQNAFDKDYEEVIGYATMGRAAFGGIRYALGRR